VKWSRLGFDVVLAGGEDRAGVDFGWSPLTFFRPAFQLLPTLQFFLPMPTLQLYLAPTPTPHTFYFMPSATPRIFIRSTPTPVPIQPKPTATPPTKK
jgi:hypothetical protein